MSRLFKLSLSNSTDPAESSVEANRSPVLVGQRVALFSQAVQISATIDPVVHHGRGYPKGGVYYIYIYPLLVIQSCNSKRPSMVQIPETPPPPSDNSAQAQLFRGCVLFPRTWVSQVDVRASSGLDSAFPAVATSPKKKGCVTFVSERTLSLSPRGRFVGCIWLHDVAFLKKLCDKSISFSGPFR